MLTDEIPYTMPGDGRGGKGKRRPIASAVTDANGRVEFNMKFLRPGRYSFFMAAANGVRSRDMVVTKTPKSDTKGDIKRENLILRNMIRVETNKEEIKKLVDGSRLCVDLAPENLKNDAMKEYEDTSKTGSKRIEQLRQQKSSWAVKVAKDGIGVKKSAKKSAIGLDDKGEEF